MPITGGIRRPCGRPSRPEEGHSKARISKTTHRACAALPFSPGISRDGENARDFDKCPRILRTELQGDPLATTARGRCHSSLSKRRRRRDLMAVHAGGAKDSSTIHRSSHRHSTAKPFAREIFTIHPARPCENRTPNLKPYFTPPAPLCGTSH